MDDGRSIEERGNTEWRKKMTSCEEYIKNSIDEIILEMFFGHEERLRPIRDKYLSGKVVYSVDAFISECEQMIFDVNAISPSYYQGKSGMQAREVIDDFDLGYNKGNVVKYVLRSGKKGGRKEEIQDLRKAIQYLEFEIQKLGVKERGEKGRKKKSEFDPHVYTDHDILMAC